MTTTRPLIHPSIHPHIWRPLCGWTERRCQSGLRWFEIKIETCLSIYQSAYTALRHGIIIISWSSPLWATPLQSMEGNFSCPLILPESSLPSSILSIIVNSSFVPIPTISTILFTYLARFPHILIKFLPPQGQKSSNPALNSSSAKDISRRRQPYHRIPQKERKAQSHGVEQLWMVCVLLTVPIARDGFRDASLRIFTTNLQRTNRDWGNSPHIDWGDEYDCGT